ncbi:hypothetical protein C0J52_09569, partial [Blattella germanica]
LKFVTEECNPNQCVTPRHYFELGCSPIHEPGTCCPARFDCRVAYDVGSELNEDPLNPCTAGCRCVNSHGKAQLSCANVECPELFNGPLTDPNCFRQFSLDQCCSTSTYCRSNTTEKQQTTSLAECHYGDKTYKEGQIIYPDDAPCKKCICKEGFNGTLVEPWCRDVSCGIELHYSTEIQDGCIPVYYGKQGCCPIDWRCPVASDVVITNETVISKNAEHKCKFGNLELKVGDKLSATSNKCIECTCGVPPQVLCTQKPYEECQNHK